jgi:glutamine cyclotransferase
MTSGLIAAIVLRLMAASVVLAGSNPLNQMPPSTLPLFSYHVEHVYPHDRTAFTQGLVYLDGFLYEGTGLNGQSSVRKVKLETGEVVQKRDLAPEHFGEGIAIWQSELLELTWRSHVAVAYDRATFTPKRTLSYPGEGWGLTHDGTSLIMSDGTDELRILDPVTFAEKRRIKVTAVGAPLRNLNELEFIKGEVFANVWLTDYIARISPDTGRVTGYIDLRGLITAADHVSSAGVLNGIAYDAARNRIFVTGKLWPKLFEISLVRKS